MTANLTATAEDLNDATYIYLTGPCNISPGLYEANAGGRHIRLYVNATDNYAEMCGCEANGGGVHQVREGCPHYRYLPRED